MARPSIAAAVDLGSNSVHVLVASATGGELEPIVDESVFLGLGDAVHDGAPLPVLKRDELIAALAGYAARARDLGATEVLFLGTEPLRRAANAASIVRAVGHAVGWPLYVLSHEEEAYLTLIGVTGGHAVTHGTLVVDIGGGSSEFAAVEPGGLATATGLRLGSARLTTAYVRHDPPDPDEVAAMVAAARQALTGAPHARPREVVGVGGTASNLVKLLPAAIDDRMLTRDRLAEVQQILAREPAAAAARRHAINPIRARLLPAGAAIVEALLERYGLDAMRASEASLREGAVLVVLHAGAGWRDRLAELARGWRS
jgi:exopolyphosphatase/pppGpp-phosphohydrolase